MSRVGAVIHFKTILAVAFLSRLGVVWETLAVHPRSWLFSNAPDLALLAASLNSGRGLSSPFGGSTGPTALLAPGYPAMVGVIFRLFGSYSFSSALVVMGMQTLFAVLTVALIMHVAHGLGGAPAANLAGAFWALSPPLLWLPTVFWDTCLSTLLLLGMVALALRCVGQPGRGLWAGMGAYCGLALLVNPSLMAAFFAVLGWTACQARPLRRHERLICLLAFLACFTPWILRNALVFHAFIPVRSCFGYELWQGNRPGATGVFDPSLYPLKNQREYSDYAVQGELAYMRSKLMMATDYIRAHPGEFIRLSARRARLFWFGPTEVDFKILELHAGCTSLLGWVGLGLLWQRNRRTALLFLLPLLVFPLPYYITRADFRYRVELDPLLTILGAYAVSRLMRYRRSGHARLALTGLRSNWILVEENAGPATEPNESAALPFVIPSEAEGSAVDSTFATKVHGKNELLCLIFRPSWRLVEGQQVARIPGLSGMTTLWFGKSLESTRSADKGRQDCWLLPRL